MFAPLHDSQSLHAVHLSMTTAQRVSKAILRRSLRKKQPCTLA